MEEEDQEEKEGKEETPDLSAIEFWEAFYSPGWALVEDDL